MKYKESQNMELKEDFNFQKTKKELSGLLNLAPIGGEVFMIIGVKDSTGELKEGYLKIDQFAREDLIKDFLNSFSVEHEFKPLSNGGLEIKAISNLTVINNGRKIFFRNGTSTKPAKEQDYIKILKNKNIKLLSPTNKTFQKKDFNILENFLADTSNKKNVEQFLIDTNCIIFYQSKMHRTYLSDFFSDDCKLSISFNDKKINGPIFNMIKKLINETNKIIKSHEFLQKDGILRKKMIEINENFEEIAREAITNLFLHSHYKLILDNPMEAKITKDGIEFENSHTDPDLKNKVENWVVPHKAHNQPLFNAVRMLDLVEGKKIGFDIFKKNRDFLTFDINASNFKIILKGAI